MKKSKYKEIDDLCDSCGLINACVYLPEAGKVTACKWYKERHETKCPVCKAELVFEYGEVAE